MARAASRTACYRSRISSASCAVCCPPTRKFQKTPRKYYRRACHDAASGSRHVASTPSTRRSEFVCFVTEEAAGRCAEEKRKTINGDDLIFALQNLGFEEYVPPLQSYLAQYRRVSKQKEKE